MPGETPGSRRAASVTQHDPPLPSWSHPAGVWGFFSFCSASFNLKALLQTPELTPGDLHLALAYGWMPSKQPVQFKHTAASSHQKGNQG